MEPSISKPRHSLVDRLSCWIFVLVVGTLPVVLARAQRLDVRHPPGEWLGDGGALLIGYGLFAAGSLLLGVCLSIAAVVLYARAKASRAFPTLSVVLLEQRECSQRRQPCRQHHRVTQIIEIRPACRHRDRVRRIRCSHQTDDRRNEI